MENHIKNLKISNFKSIKEIELECSRINLIVGKPNVGKSNILEAISMYSAHYSQYQSERFLNDFIRYEGVSNLFYSQEIERFVKIESNIGVAFLKYDYSSDLFTWVFGPTKVIFEEFTKGNPIDERHLFSINNPIIPYSYVISDSEGNRKSFSISGKITPVKKYSFREINFSNGRDNKFLLPPYGDNLFNVLRTNTNLKEILPELFSEYDLEVVFDIQRKAIELQRKVEGLVYKIPYSLVANTLQRIIFYYSAIFSNENSTILFEEPENHSFPPYIWELSHRIINSESNQFFITTHSPYLFNTIVENTSEKELAVFVTEFKDFETKIKRLSDLEISDLLNYGIDIFSNINRFWNE